jgi:hypothetical protein
MIAFYIALVAGTAIAIVYITLVLRAFLRLRRSVIDGTAASTASSTAEDSAEGYEQQGRNFGWKAGAGVVASTGLLALVSLTSWAWYILPFLGLGSSIAVIAAFLIDRKEAATS